MLSSMRSSFQSRTASTGARLHQLVGVHEREVADEDRHALAEPPRLARPARRGVLGRRQRVGGRLPPPAGGVVHHVVVEQREGVHQLERRTRIDVDLVVVATAGADEPPVAERRSQPLAAGEHEPADLVDRVAPGRVEGRPAVALGRQQVAEPGIDPFRDGGEGRRRRR